MNRATLETPKSGRSRFSKALPAPPPGLEDDRPRTASRNLPSLPYSPFPPRKESVSVKTSTSPGIKSNLGNLPLPSLPPDNNTMEAAPMQTQTRAIPRKPVGLPANPAPSAAAKSKKMKRVSSISSLLSAYSNTSSDSVQRSSQGSVFTKDSEPSNSPEREGMNDVQQVLTKAFPVFQSNPYADELPQVTDEIVAADLPPPPPLKDLDRPSTPPNVRPVGQSPISRTSARDESPSGDSPTLTGASPQRREIWRRRASSKTDRGPLVPELKLAVSHGSTAATVQPVNQEDLLPLPPPPQINNSTTSPLPPRSASLPGRNIRPNRQVEAQDENEMRKLSSKLKELTSRGDTSNDSKNPEDGLLGMSEYIKGIGSGEKPKIEADQNLAPPIKDQPTVGKTTSNASKTSVDTVVFAPAPAPTPAPAPAAVPASSSPTTPSEPPPRESGEKSVSRRPVGVPTPNQPEVHQKGSSSDLRKQALGLPRFPRPSQSNSSLRSPSDPRNVQETVRPKVSPQASPPAAMPSISLPGDSGEPIKKPELFNLVTSLNESNYSPDPTGNRKPSRKVSRDVDATGLSDIGESAENMTPEQMQRVNEALSRFPRNIAQMVPSAGIWQAAPIRSQHYNCYARHNRWVPVKNTNYPLACQTCGVQDTSSRKTCSFCNLRICFKCQERLTGSYKSDLKSLMANMELDVHQEKQREKGKQREAA